MLLNVEAVGAVQERMAKDQTRIAELVTALTGTVQGLENGAWVGNSASQFFAEYEMENAKWKRQLEVLRILAERMEQEIHEWEHAAEKFG
ncbi:MAG: hypothetical protein JW748_03020 [Anaerolineales bacterium]|nr:hypothetical protein [Anaerolineales bacterium]